MPAIKPEGRWCGPLFAIGGAEDKVGECRLLRYFVQLCGGSDARIAILPTASELAASGSLYAELFARLGAEPILIDIQKRGDAGAPAAVHALQQATGLFLTGGNQLKLLSILGGTPLHEAIRRAHAGGLPVAGTSAGASALSAHMIENGRSGHVPRYGMVRFAPGLSLIGAAVIDQHFSQRRRLGRLMTAIASNPALVGLGVDEDTAALIDADGTMQVIGRGGVTVVDGSTISYTDLHRLRSGQAATIAGITLHTLYEGSVYNLHSRALVSVEPVSDALVDLPQVDLSLH